MTSLAPYSYTVLRYVHDVLTGEFVNVGVVLVHERCVKFKTKTTIGRIKGVFPDVDRAAFLSAMYAARRALQSVAKKHSTSGLFQSEATAEAIAREAVAVDDSSLQWSPQGGGVSENTDGTLDRLYERFVTRYDAHYPSRRTDDDIWRPVRQKLEERNIAQVFQEKTIHGSLDDIVFKHAWKNGMWHVYEPLSFDLADADGIKTKAREWLGHLSAVVAGGSTENFKPHFIVGAPSNDALRNAYHSAVAILKKAPNEPEVFEESEVDTLVSQIEDEVVAHRT